ncbi:MAG TPA: hypothetical protein VFS32_07110 [Candidatus Limnocylindrales bacterium]|nr:hypothetical protein [Candidatus Limnocylindrales bacterium]
MVRSPWLIVAWSPLVIGVPAVLAIWIAGLALLLVVCAFTSRSHR